ncbi:malto-oligosyltrehalose trehalohydrolase [Chelatococcus reniformis]|uniref:Malto-oligosyltrehalose trehalohydrolase n=1 Tax=Chelatococcus reniformis TaxID=1494448 RepID=A0A916X8E9_9HYPH|nr:malto-oligosyltrehalose trehalohydrolase [Chelatococcus reniformis]GGC54582.1 malto-oligosyltrehalose trehalohydrolase [Chelatococcus reniformis]
MYRTHAMPFGAELSDEGVRFALWAPNAAKVELVVDGEAQEMTAAEQGWHRLASARAAAGSRYAFRIDDRLEVPDPASRFQPDDVHAASLVVDPRAYTWTDARWTGRPWSETVLYEVHVGTATPEGTYAALMPKLAELKELGITAIELLPIGDFAGRRNWGYDGVLPFAPDSAYGGPEDLKRLVDHAHGLGLMMILDVVYNHFGPSGNYLHAYAESFFTDRHRTPWGAGINFDGATSGIVRDYFVHNALYWLEEYHFDGLRFDAVHAILDDGRPHFIDELANRIRDAIRGRHVHLVLENDANQARWLERDDRARPVLHTAQWADDIHNAWHALLTGEAEGYYEDYADRPLERLSRALAEGFAYQGDPSAHKGGAARGEPSAHLPPTAFVAFLQNHDQVGNRAFGERLSRLVPEEKLALARAALLLGPQVPLLFMGEDWSASTPFQFFVDFADDPTLSDAVREGRRAEFAKFKAFSDPDARERVPDPTSEDTFHRSVLNWSEADQPAHRAVREDVRELLGLRQRHVEPLIASGFRGSQQDLTVPDMLDVTWRFDAGMLRLLANVGSFPITVAVGTARPIWSRHATTTPGHGHNLTSSTMAPWGGLVLVEPAA